MKSLVPRLLTTMLAVTALSLLSAHAGTRIERDAGAADRPGGDYRNFPLPRRDPGLCSDACFTDGQCRAYTYVAPATRQDAPRCYLKSRVPQKLASPCCTSGRKTYVADPRPSAPAEIQPPPEFTANQQWCEIGMICALRHKGKWGDPLPGCNCPPLTGETDTSTDAPQPPDGQ
ncbi:PAN domain-containing protein [Derxia gummosa]|uniref:PAN domain-containing protein n=1 Tax=Derxia gummosa DSM 723 TaxID=1121388 RepID=A0A8B6XBC6_9BURK|nr:PAN domain-containing protein [Derxia gummosa]